MVTRSIESAQRKVEARNFDIRKQLLEYDDVANDQRKVIYQQRNDLLEARRAVAADRRPARRRDRRTFCAPTCPPDSVEEQWDLKGLEQALTTSGSSSCRRRWLEAEPSSTDEDVLERIVEAARRAVPRQDRARRRRAVHAFERCVMLQIARQPLARAPGRARPPAPGHPPARLRAEEPEAGVQARGVRAVRRMLDSVKLEVIKRLTAAGADAATKYQPVDDQQHVENVRAQRGEFEERGWRRQRQRRRGDRRGGDEKRPDRRARCRRSAATTPAPAARARNTSTATASSPRMSRRHARDAVTARLVAAGRAMPGNLRPDRRLHPVRAWSSALPWPASRSRTAAICWSCACRRARTVAGVFTRNRFCAAPVLLCSKNLAAEARMRALVVNTGNANAGTGDDGLKRRAAGLR